MLQTLLFLLQSILQKNSRQFPMYEFIVLLKAIASCLVVNSHFDSIGQLRNCPLVEQLGTAYFLLPQVFKMLILNKRLGHGI